MTAEIRLDFVVNSIRTLLGEDDDGADEPGSTRTPDESIVRFLKMVLWDFATNRAAYFENHRGSDEKSLDEVISELEYTATAGDDGVAQYPVVPLNPHSVRAVVSEVFQFLQVRNENIVRPETAVLQQRQTGER